MTGWDGRAEGIVEISHREGVIEFFEQCRFRPDSGGEMELKNRYRWTLLTDGVNLSHVRRRKPVDLVTLVPVSDVLLRPRNPHLCGKDCYRLDVELKSSGFDALWRITGPRKDERLRYYYR